MGRIAGRWRRVPTAHTGSHALAYTLTYTQMHTQTLRSHNTKAHIGTIIHTSLTQTIDTHTHTPILSQKYTKYLHRKYALTYTHTHNVPSYTQKYKPIYKYTHGHTLICSPKCIFTVTNHTHTQPHTCAQQTHAYIYTQHTHTQHKLHTKTHPYTKHFYSHSHKHTHRQTHTQRHKQIHQHNKHEHTDTHERTNTFVQKYAHILIHKNSQTYEYIVMGIHTLSQSHSHRRHTRLLHPGTHTYP